MKKTRLLLLVLVSLLTFCVPTAFAGSFSLLASTGTLQLSNNQAWEQSYKTELGKFKIRFRKLWNNSDQKKYHLIIWWNDKRIADGYCPSSYHGYGFKIFQDQNTSRIFVALETRPRVVLMGYDPVAKRLEKYVDSKEYYSPRPNPQMEIDKDRDLLLSFIGNGYGIRTQYKLFWDDKKNWFGYKDVTVHPVQSDATESEYEPEYEPSYEPQPTPVPSSSSSDELFYPEEEIVTGS